MGTVQQSGSIGGTSRGKSTAPKRYGQVHPTVPARDLVATLIAKTGQKLFGATAPLAMTSVRGQEAKLEGVSPAVFLNARAEHFGIPGVKAAIGQSLDEAVIAVARQITEKVAKPANLNADQLSRIALEYVASACVISASEIEPFSTYLIRSMEYRQAVKALNAAAANSEPGEFQANDQARIEARNAQAQKAWGAITTLLSSSRHLAALRTTIAAPFIYTAMDAWKALQELDAEQRNATVGQLRCMVSETGNPFVSETEVWAAYARVQGSELLSTGNRFGVAIETAIGAISQTRLAQVRPNGGKQVTFDAASPEAVGASIAGLRGNVTGKVTAKDGRTIGLELEVREGLPGTGSIAVPVPAPTSGRPQFATA